MRSSKQYVDPRAADLLDRESMRSRALATEAPLPGIAPEPMTVDPNAARAAFADSLTGDIAPPDSIDPWLNDAGMQVDPGAARDAFADALGSRPVAPQAAPQMARPAPLPGIAWDDVASPMRSAMGALDAAPGRLAAMAPARPAQAPPGGAPEQFRGAPTSVGQLPTVAAPLAPRPGATPAFTLTTGTERMPSAMRYNEPAESGALPADRSFAQPYDAALNQYMGESPDTRMDSPRQPDILPWDDAEQPQTANRPDALPFVAPDDTENVPIAQTGGNKAKEGNPFAVSPEDRQRIADAERGDRRRRIAGGVMRGLGALVGLAGTAAGVPGVGALGTLVGAGGAALRTDRADEERGLQRQEMQRRLAASNYDQSRNDADLNRQGQQQQFALRQQSAESNMAVDRARVAQLETATRQAQNEIDATGADAGAARNILAHFAAGLNDNSPAADQLRAAIADPSFAGMSAQTARETMARYAQLANRRGAGLIDNGGGGGGGVREIINADGTVTRVSTGGGGARRGGGSGGAPVAARPAGGAPAPAGPSPAEIAGQQLTADESDFSNVIIDGMRAAGIDPASDAGRRELRSALYTRAHSATDADRNAPLAQARQRLATAALEQSGGLPPGVSRQELSSIDNATMTAQANAQATRRFLARLGAYQQSDPDGLRYALQHADIQDGAAATALDLRAMRIRQDLQSQINAILSRYAGANVTPNEMERNLRAQGVGALASNPDGVRAAFHDRESEFLDRVRTGLRTVSPRTQRYFLTGR